MRVFNLAISLILSFALSGCSIHPPVHIQQDQQIILPCSSTPNCVSSIDDRPDFHVEPINEFLTLNDIHHALKSLPQCDIAKETQSYLHLECHSLIFRFVDDFELLIRNGELHLRSASRIGYSDLGINRKRVNTFTQALILRAPQE